jgi:hypothetical protein
MKKIENRLLFSGDGPMIIAETSFAGREDSVS